MHVGISAGQLDQYLDGSLPGMDVLLRIVEKTGCSPAWLLTGEGEPYPPERPESAEGQAALQEGMRRSAAAAVEALHAIAAMAPLAKDAGMLPDETTLAVAMSAAQSAIADRRREIDASKGKK